MRSTAPPATPERADIARSLALGAAATAQALVPTLGPVFAGTRENAERFDTVITPPDYAFVIWGPIFAGCLANAVQHALPRHTTSSANRRSGWPLAGAYTLNAVWSLAAQGDRFQLTPAILPTVVGCAAVAYRRLQRVQPVGAETVASASTGLLLGWTGLAATVNIAAGARILGADPTSPTTIRLSTIGAVGVAAANCAATLRSQRGFVPLAAATTWGLATTALNTARPPLVRAGAALGAIATTATAAIRASAIRRREGAADGVHPG